MTLIYSLLEVNSTNNCQSEGLSRATDCFKALIASSFLLTAIQAKNQQ
jgi:hypothetical protein